MNNSQYYDKEAFLINVKNEMEANILIGLLKMSDISCSKVDKGLGEVYLGSENLGVDIFVAQKNLEEAKKIIQASPEVDETFEEQVDEDSTISQKSYRNKRSIMIWIIILIFFIPVIPFAITYLVSILQ